MKLPRHDKEMMDILYKHVIRHRLCVGNPNYAKVTIHNITIMGESEKAYHVNFGKSIMAKHGWIPKSHCTYDPIANTIVIPQWLAKARNL